MCNDDDIAAGAERITGGKGAYGAIDCVAGDLTGQMLAAVRPGGQILVYGAMAGFSTTLNVGDLLFKQKVGTGPWSCCCILCTGLRGLMTVMGRICCLCKGSVQLADAKLVHMLVTCSRLPMSSLHTLLVPAQVARGFGLGSWVQSLGDRKQAVLEEIMGMVADKVIDPLIGKSYDLTQVAEAVKEAQRQGRGGKVLLKG